MLCALNSDVDTLIGIGGPFVYKIWSSGAPVTVSDCPLVGTNSYEFFYEHIHRLLVCSSVFPVSKVFFLITFCLLSVWCFRCGCV